MKFEVTSSQKNFLINSKENLWNHGLVCWFYKRYSYEQLNDSFNCFVEKFDSIRIVSNSNSSTTVTPFKRVNYPFMSFDNKEHLVKEVNLLVNKPIDIKQSLFGCIIFQTDGGSGYIINAHHLILDGFCGQIMCDFLNTVINEGSYSKKAEDYQTHIQNEKTYISSKRYKKDYDFWLNQFSLNPQCSIFEEKKTSFDYESDEVNFRVAPEMFDKIKTYCYNNEISVQSFFNTVYSVYIYRTSGTDFFTLGVPVLNRTTEAELNTIGLYMHIVPLIVKLSDSSFLQNAAEIEDAQMNLFRHQKFTQHDIKELLKEEGKPQNNLFDIAADYQEFGENEDYEFEFVYSNSLSLPLEIHMQSFGDKNHNLKIRYRTSMFTEKEIQTMLNSFIAIIEDSLENPEKKISELEMLLPDEKQKVLYEFNNTHREYRKDRCIQELFEAQAEKTPDKVAVVAADKTLTYRELNEQANRIAHSLIEKGIGRGDIVGLMLPRRSSLLSALFGILKAGAAYLPIDPDHPQERIKYMISDSGAGQCITEDNIKDFLNNTKTVNPANTSESEDICYCIYTSGSTGRPKGTLVYHRNLIWYMSVLKGIYGTDNINMPFFTSQCVDLTVPSIYLPLITGGTSYMYNGELKDDLVKIFDNENLTVLKFTPTHMKIICNLIPAKERLNIRHVIVGGETLYRENCLEFLNKFGKHIEIHNEYGPTETTVSCTDYVFTPDEKGKEAYLPIGKPIANTQTYILDKYMKPVPVGATGELCIAGDGVGAGYLNNAELTRERFVKNPFGGGMLYRTGDLAYQCEDGNIVFVGRQDLQIKISGQRIELGEIESVIQHLYGVFHCAVTVREDSEGRTLLCAFYTGEERNVKELREEAGRNLPKHMVPHIFIRLTEMPLTPSGKINRRALPEIDLESISSETEYAAPDTEKEKALSEVLCSVLKTDSVNMLDSFFDIGGDSIKAIYVVSELADMGYELHVADIMQPDTFLAVAKTMRSTSFKAIYEQGEVNGFIPFTPIMRAFLEECNEIPEDYVHTCVISADCDECTAKKALDTLVSHHDILRGTFCDGGIEIQPSDERKVYSFRSVCIDDEKEAKEYLKDTKLTEDRLVKVVFCSTAKENLISITVHHFLIDLVSWEILIKDFRIAVDQLKNNKNVSLHSKTASFMLWNEELEKYSEKISKECRVYWESVNERLNNTRHLRSEEETVNEAEIYNYTFDKDFSDALINEVSRVYGTRTNEVLLTVLGLAACEIAQGSVGIIVESHGRTEIDKSVAIERTVGWFTSCYPVIIDTDNEIDALISIKDELRRMPGNGIDYLLLNKKIHKKIDVKFNFYQNSTYYEEEKETMLFNSDTSVFPGKINVNCFVVDGALSVNITVPKCIHRHRISELLGMEFKNQAEKLVDICKNSTSAVKTRSDFSDEELTETELEELKDLFDWTDDNGQ